MPLIQHAWCTSLDFAFTLMTPPVPATIQTFFFESVRALCTGLCGKTLNIFTTSRDDYDACIANAHLLSSAAEIFQCSGWILFDASVAVVRKQTHKVQGFCGNFVRIHFYWRKKRIWRYIILKERGRCIQYSKVENAYFTYQHFPFRLLF